MSNPLNPLAKPDPLTPCLALRPREAAAALGISPRTLWAWTAANEIPHIRQGKAVLYSVANLQRWLSEKSTSGEGVR